MIGSHTFGATPIRSPGGHAASFEETDRRLAPVLERVPVTRVYDATPLDYLGVPVWAAVTPLARDLKVHAGKGETPTAARISAVMEAVERVSAEKVDTERVRKASYAELARADAGGVVDPRLFDLPFETTYRDDLPISWVDGYDIRTDRAAWVPLDVAISPACERVCAGVETNGLAAGNTYTEAVVHALHEVIERDAYSHACFRSLYEDPDRGDAVTVIEPESLPRPAAELLNRVQSGGVRATVRAVPHDIDVPVFRVTIADRSFPGREGRLTRFAGLGCDLDPMRAVTRAICEAAQSHTALFVGARDTFESGPRRPGLSTDRLISMLVSRPTVQPYPGTCADAFPDDLYQRLLLLLERLERAGLDRCIVVDLSRADLGIPVVRVLVPGASGPYGNTPRRPSLRLLRTLV